MALAEHCVIVKDTGLPEVEVMRSINFLRLHVLLDEGLLRSLSEDARITRTSPFGLERKPDSSGVAGLDEVRLGSA